MEHKPLIVNGSPDFQKAVPEVSVEFNLPVSFHAPLFQREFELQKEDKDNDRKKFIANGGRIFTKRPNSKPTIAPTHAKSVEDATQIGFRLPTMTWTSSQKNVISTCDGIFLPSEQV